MKYTIDYTQDENGRWSARLSETIGYTAGGARVVGMTFRTPSRLTLEDAVNDVFDMLGDCAVLEVGDVREFTAS